jgi:molybdopterin molybdotransferase
VLARDVASRDDVPPFDNSAMDGFAVRAADTTGAAEDTPVTLAIAGESRAGAPASTALKPGSAIRISTGAMLPRGADAVVRKESCREHDAAVGVLAAVEPGQELRRAGEDIRAEETVLEAGTLLGPAELGVAASVGAGELECARRPRVAVVITGDELVEPGGQLEPGQIRNTNGYAIPAQVREAGGEPSRPLRAPDDRAATVEVLRRSLDDDVVVICGGVSVGPHDHVRPALAELGAEEVFWGVALRPGHPTWFGVHGERPALVFGLPGNPVSAMVTFHLFVRPAIAVLQGADPGRRISTAVMDEDYAKRPGRAHVVRCRLEARDDGWHVRPTKAQGSHVLTSMLGAEALALIEVERETVRAGERVTIEVL